MYKMLNVMMNTNILSYLISTLLHFIILFLKYT